MIEPRGNDRIQIRNQIRSVRTLRSDLYALAEAIAGNPALRGHLILIDPKISGERIEKEKKIAQKLFSPDLINRIQIEYGTPYEIQEDRNTIHLKRADSWFEITKLLMRQYLLKLGPVTTQWITETVGCTYPTAAKALDRLESYISRGSDRRVELSRFPRDVWDELLITARSARSTVWFVDRSGQPRSPDALLKRMESKLRTKIAIGGSTGARHWYPELDLTGDPRLDLIVHCPGKEMNLGFVNELDPALEQVEHRSGEASLAVHAMRREVSLFEVEATPWADVLECLLDLHELGLQHQAVEFRQHLEDRQGSSWK